MKSWIAFAFLSFTLFLVPGLAFSQINFPKNAYYVGMGDSVATGEGALPVTGGYVYRLYGEGVFGLKTAMDFANVAVRGGRSWDLRDHQAAQVLCAEPEQRPTVVTITAGADDFLRGDADISGIARRVAEAIDLLLNNDGSLSLGEPPILDPVTHTPCRALQNVAILVSNYYSVPHPDPAVFAMLEAALKGFDAALRAWVGNVGVPTGSRVAIVDLYTPSLGRRGLVTIQRRLGLGSSGPWDFDIHPTNLGHVFIAGEFAKVWNSLQQ